MTTTAATTYTATLPNGKTVTRKSKRTYTHFYAVSKNENGRREGLTISDGWHFGGFAGSKAHAEKAAAADSRGLFDWVVLEVSAQP